MGCIRSTMLPGPRTSVSFPLASLIVPGIWGESVFELCVLEQHMELWVGQKLVLRRGVKCVQVVVRGCIRSHVSLDCGPSLLLSFGFAQQENHQTHTLRKHQALRLPVVVVVFKIIIPTDSSGFFFYLLPTRYPFISKQKKRSACCFCSISNPVVFRCFILVHVHEI